MAFNEKEYIKKYHKENIKYTKIEFNMKKESDLKLYDILSKIENKTAYLKRLITFDFKNKGLID